MEVMRSSVLVVDDDRAFSALVDVRMTDSPWQPRVVVTPPTPVPAHLLRPCERRGRLVAKADLPDGLLRRMLPGD
jgi:hypothetical protein